MEQESKFEEIDKYILLKRKKSELISKVIITTQWHRVKELHREFTSETSSLCNSVSQNI